MERTRLEELIHNVPRPGLREVHENRLEPDPKPVGFPPSPVIPGSRGCPLPFVRPREQAVIVSNTIPHPRKEARFLSSTVVGAVVVIGWLEDDERVGTHPYRERAPHQRQCKGRICYLRVDAKLKHVIELGQCEGSDGKVKEEAVLAPCWHKTCGTRVL